MKGLVHIYTGNGKGKTTAALGLLLRALGNDMNVYYTEYLKTTTSSELKFLNKIKNNLTLGYKSQISKFSFNMTKEELSSTKKIISNQFDKNTNRVINSSYDIVIFDELINAVSLNFLPKEKVIKFINTKPENVEIIMTGRNAPNELIEISDYVSEIHEIKHPFKNGIKSRKGIEY